MLKMMKGKVAIFCFASILLADLTSGAISSCKQCPAKNPLPCHEVRRFSKPCKCSICLTKCDEREAVCKKGEACVTEAVYFDSKKVGETAACKPFEECPQVECSNKCPESGFFVDINGCGTCLCKDPCKELKCPGECAASSINPGTESIYQCE